MAALWGQTRPARGKHRPARSLVARIALESAAWGGILLAALAVAGLLIVALGPKLVGWSFVVVAGGSMEPAIPFGSLAVMESLGTGAPTAGDIVMYRDPSRSGEVVTHRIESVSPDGRTLITRGDANPSADLDPVPVTAVEARYRFALPQAGRLVYWAHTRSGYVAMVVLPGLAVIAWELGSVARAVREGRRKLRARAVPAPQNLGEQGSLPLALLFSRSSAQHPWSPSHVRPADRYTRRW